jgi:hypothetical protein
MGKRPDKSVGNGEKTETDAPKPLVAESAGAGSEAPQSHAIDSNLPVVEAPKLDGGEAMVPAGDESLADLPKLEVAEAILPPEVEALDEAPSEPATRADDGSSRFALLAATIAVAAALGSFLGSLSASGIVRLFPADTNAVNTADTRDVLQAVKTQLAQLSVLKTNIDGANKNANTQFAKIADRLDRLDKRAMASSETTGSIPAAQPAAPEPKPPVLEGWTVQDVQNGRALVGSRYGGVFEVGTGSFLPGIGRVESIKREDGKWLVLTARGVITSVH